MKKKDRNKMCIILSYNSGNLDKKGIALMLKIFEKLTSPHSLGVQTFLK